VRGERLCPRRRRRRRLHGGPGRRWRGRERHLCRGRGVHRHNLGGRGRRGRHGALLVRRRRRRRERGGARRRGACGGGRRRRGGLCLHHQHACGRVWRRWWQLRRCCLRGRRRHKQRRERRAGNVGGRDERRLQTRSHFGQRGSNAAHWGRHCERRPGRQLQPRELVVRRRQRRVGVCVWRARRLQHGPVLRRGRRGGRGLLWRRRRLLRREHPRASGGGGQHLVRGRGGEGCGGGGRGRGGAGRPGRRRQRAPVLRLRGDGHRLARQLAKPNTGCLAKCGPLCHRNVEVQCAAVLSLRWCPRHKLLEYGAGGLRGLLHRLPRRQLLAAVSHHMRSSAMQMLVEHHRAGTFYYSAGHRCKRVSAQRRVAVRLNRGLHWTYAVFHQPASNNDGPRPCNHRLQHQRGQHMDQHIKLRGAGHTNCLLREHPRGGRGRRPVLHWLWRRRFIHGLPAMGGHDAHWHAVNPPPRGGRRAAWQHGLRLPRAAGARLHGRAAGGGRRRRQRPKRRQRRGRGCVLHRRSQPHRGGAANHGVHWQRRRKLLKRVLERWRGGGERCAGHPRRAARRRGRRRRRRRQERADSNGWRWWFAGWRRRSGW
jgi:hypothetical protein